MPAPLPDLLAQYLRALQAGGTETLLLSREARGLLRQLKSAKSSVPRVEETGRTAVARPVPSRVVQAKPAEPIPSIPPAAPEPIAVGSGPKAEELARLQERALACVKCPHLVKTRKNVVFGIGNPEAELMFIGEAPGADEDEEGEPFVGRAGEILTKMIKAMGLERGGVYISNVLKCRPDMPVGAPGNRKPTTDEMRTCLPYVTAQIEVIRPKVIVALGATALEGLLEMKTPIGKARGQFLEFRGIPVMPTYHPAYILRNQANSEKRKVWEDLLKVMEKLDLPISDKQRGFFL
jgi:DNA polymerase